MTEYWKSQPRRFCKFCQCWTADNKVSIEFHERGKNHQENVKRKLNDLCRKGKRDSDAQRRIDKDVQRMEKAAMAAFSAEAKDNPQLQAELARERLAYESKAAAGPSKPKPSTAPSRTGGSEGSCPSKPKQKKAEDGPYGYAHYSDIYREIRDDANKPVRVVEGPAPKPDPYGQWVEIQPPKPEALVDLQLPKLDAAFEHSVPVAKDETFKKMKFKERTVGSLGSSSKVGSSEDGDTTDLFKKRKTGDGFKRNVRKRTGD